MRWSKLKQRIEERFFDGAKGRVEIFVTLHRKSHDQEGEYWLTIDGKKIFGTGSLAYFKQEHLLVENFEKEGFSKNESDAKARKKLKDSGVVLLEDFLGQLRASLNDSIEEMLDSPSQIVRALAVLDSRCGRRRLEKIDVEKEHPLVQKLYRLRVGLS